VGSGGLAALKLFPESAKKSRCLVFRYPPAKNDNAKHTMRGMIYWLGTQCGKKEWSNPVTNNTVKLTSSTVCSGTLSTLVDSTNSSFYLSNLTGNEYLQFDFGKYAVVPSHYTLRHSTVDSNNYFIRTWEFQGSNDGKEWTVIKRYNSDQSMNSSCREKTFDVSCTKAYKQLKIANKGPESYGSYYMMVSGFEVYGRLASANNTEEMGGGEEEEKKKKEEEEKKKKDDEEKAKASSS